jgi:anaerobic selenocysteine-containing dehydrogenase
MWYSYDPDRILYPLKRVGARGEGKWKRITWDEALTELAGKLDAAIKEDPNTIMMKYGRNRTGGTIDRFMQTLGSATVVNHTSVCESSKKVGMEPTWGPDIETPGCAHFPRQPLRRSYPERRAGTGDQPDARHCRQAQTHRG